MDDLNEICQSLSDERVIELVTELGSDEYQDTATAIIFKTICHNVDPSNASMKLYYYKKNKLFHCYTGCGDSFDLIGLFKRRYELLGIKYNFYKDIVLKIKEKSDFISTEQTFYEPYKSQFEKYKEKEINVQLKVLNPNLLNIYTFNPTPEWLNDGISEEVMKRFNILYDIKENKVIIPHYNEKGELIGIRGRALNQESVEAGIKYMPVEIEGQLLNHPLGYNLYGLNLVKDNIKRTGIALVAEGEKSVLQYETMFGKENNICVAACGSSFHTYQFELLASAGAGTILICFDKEGETWKEQQLYYNKLKKICLKYKNRCKMGFLWDTKGLLNLKDSPFDKGQETFKKLYKGAIYV